MTLKTGKKRRSVNFHSSLKEILQQVNPQKKFSPSALCLLNNLSNEILNKFRDDAIFASSRSGSTTLSAFRSMELILAGVPDRLRERIRRDTNKVVSNFKEEKELKKKQKEEKQDMINAMTEEGKKEHYEKHRPNFVKKQ